MPDLKGELKSLLSFVSADGANVDHAEIHEPGSPLNKVIIVELEKTHLVMTPDDGRRIPCSSSKCNHVTTGIVTPLFNTGPSIKAHKMCDGIVAHIAGSSIDLVFLDVKAGQRSGVGDQLRCAECFFYYVQRILKVFHDVNMDIKSVQYVVVTLGSRIPIKQAIGFDSRGNLKADTPRLVAVDSQNHVRIASLLYV